MSTKPANVDDDVIDVEELKDGSAEVEIPEELAPNQDEAVSLAEGGEADSDEALRDAKRARRRAKRELMRQTSAEKDQRLNLLQKQNDELVQRLAAIEKRSHANDVEKVDRALQDENLRMQYAKSKVSEAASSNDGEALTKAQEMWFDSQKKIDALKKLRQFATQEKQPPIDQKIVIQTQEWLKRNTWYDPDAKDTDSKIAKQIDEAITQEGFDPRTAEYWDELDDRLQKYLPHRYNKKSSNSTSRPRSMQTSAGRESYSGDRRSFTLSAEQVRAMKEAGMWDDPEKRNKMIKRYAQESRKYNDAKGY